MNPVAPSFRATPPPAYVAQHNGEADRARRSVSPDDAFWERLHSAALTPLGERPSAPILPPCPETPIYHLPEGVPPDSWRDRQLPVPDLTVTIDAVESIDPEVDAFVPSFMQPLPALNRERVKADLKNLPLHMSIWGRCLLGLAYLTWYRLPSGLYVTRMPEGADNRVAGQLAQIINWMRCGARAHPSNLTRVLALQHLGHLNRIIMRDNMPPIGCLDGTPDWMADMPGYRSRTIYRAHSPYESPWNIPR